MADHTSTSDASMNDRSMETSSATTTTTSTAKGKGKATDVSRTSMEDEHDNEEESSDDETGAEDEVSPPVLSPFFSFPKSPPLPSHSRTCLASIHSIWL